MVRAPARVRHAVFALRLIGARNAVLAARYAARRDRLDRGLDDPTDGPVRTPGALLEAHAGHGRVCARFAHATLELRVLADDTVSLGWDGALDLPSYAVLPWPQAPPTLRLSDKPSGIVVRTGALTVRVGPDGAVRIDDRHGRLVRADAPPHWSGRSWELRTTLPAGATLHGLGGRGHGWTLPHGEYRCWNTDPGGIWSAGADPLYVTTPAYLALSDDGALHAFHDTTFEGAVRRHDGGLDVAFRDGPLRYHVAVGTPAIVLNRFTTLTGAPALPPRWALGHHQARWGYRTGALVREVVRGYAEHDLPLACLQLDIDVMADNRDFTIDPERFADFDALVADLEAQGVRVVAIVDAAVPRRPGDPVHDEGEALGAWCRTPDGRALEGVVWPGRTVFPDHTRPDVRAWWGTQYARLLDRGVAGFWQDMNEPSCFAAWGEPSLPHATRHDLDGRGGDHREAHNVYGLLMNRAAYEGVRAARPDRRPFLFSRSGWAGQQRAGGHWAGDIATGWSSLRAALGYLLGLGVCGVPFGGSDIGGFTGDPAPELYLRWLQLGAFMPLCRIHGAQTTRPREPWTFGEAVLAAAREALRLRERLLPHWYTLAHEASQTGAPYCRPLAWADLRLRGHGDAFLLGDTLLVAPALDEGARRVTVPLPAGTWVDPRDGTRRAGGRTVTLDAPLERIPWLVRAGAAIPTAEAGDLVLLVAAPEPGEPAPGGRLWTDDGDGWEPGRLERYRVEGEKGAALVRRTVEREGPFPWSGIAAREPGGRPVAIA